MSRRTILCALAALFLWGCASDLHTRMPGTRAPGSGTGTIIVLLTQPARDLTVTVNGALVADREHTSKLTVDGVKLGHADVIIAAGAGKTRVDRSLRVEVREDRPAVIPLAAPEEGIFSSFSSVGLVSLGLAVVGKAIYFAFF